LHHRDFLPGERSTKIVRTAWVKFKSNNTGASLNERSRERTRTGTNIENEVTGRDAGVSNESFGPPTIESVPSPSCPFLGHGKPS
jgi:hypothetical protein